MIDPARSFERAAEEYDRGRPVWPEAVLDPVPVPPGATVLDLGAGTGKLTETLVKRYARVTAVEPLDRMRAFIERRAPAARILAGRAEEIPLADAAVDAVFVAQAFHWFATDEAVAEIARVITDGGLAVLLWNQRSPDEQSPLPDAYRERLRQIRESAPEPPRDSRFALERGPFGPLETVLVDHEQVSDREHVLAFAASTSQIAHRPDDERRSLLAELGELLPAGEYRFRWRAEVSWAFRRPRR